MNKDIRLSAETARKELTDFINMLESRLDYAYGNDNRMMKLYEQDFVLSFMGKECRIAFGATEYYAVLGMLNDILEEM